MGRILVLLFLALLIYALFRGFLRAQTRKPPPPAATDARGEDMVTCARCGVHLPRSSAREEAGRLVCENNPHCH